MDPYLSSPTPTLIRNVQFVRPGHSIRRGSLMIADGKIQSIFLADADGGDARLQKKSDAQAAAAPGIIDGGGRLLTPGLIDIHAHGIGPYLYERSAQDIRKAAGRLARHGTTCVLPTLVHVMRPATLKHLESLSETAASVADVCYPGLHLEGPFLTLPGGGTDTIAGDRSLLDELIGACHGRITAMSVSPDASNVIPIIERLVENKIVPFITHTRATAEQTERAIDAGARNATHFYDVFPVPNETDPGVRPVGAVEAVLADPRCTVDFICDGVHVHPTAVKAALAAKGPQGVLLTTDANVGAGMRDGIYQTMSGRIRVVANNAARIHDPGGRRDGMLAGSALTMDVGMANLHRWLSTRLASEQIWAMGTSSVAAMLGLAGKGKIEVGADADLVLWDDGFRVVKTWVNGKLVYVASA